MASLLDTPRPRHRGICRERRNRPARRRSAGYALVLVVLLLFGLMGLAALVIDIGFARLAQLQMQAAADTAALEGLRFRDELPARLQRGSLGFDRDEFDEVDRAIQEAGGQPAPESDYDPQQEEWQRWTEQARRWWVGDIVRQVFDDDVDPDTGHRIRYGAGPRIEFEGGFGPEELAAGQTVDLETLGVWEPSLQLNLPNHHYGDVVAGRYDRDHVFVPEPEGTPPQQLANAPALQVVLRRTNNLSGSDNIPHVSSRGSPIPFMFARATAIGKVPGETYSPREHGIELEATGTADARPVLSVGLPNRKVKPPLTGLVANEAMSFSFVLTLNSNNWNKFPVNEEVKATVTKEGWIEIKNEHDEKQPVEPVGLFYELELSVEAQRSLLPLVIGRSLPSPAVPPEDQEVFFGIQTPTGEIRPGYVPVYTKISDNSASTDRVVGFVEVTAEVWTEDNKKNVRFTRWAPRIVSENASAAVYHPLRPDGNKLTSNEPEDILQLNDENNHEWLLAPVSVR